VKRIDPRDNQSNQSNPNKGSPGTNRQYDQAQGNRGTQLNPNRTSAAQDDEDFEELEDDVFWWSGCED